MITHHRDRRGHHDFVALEPAQVGDATDPRLRHDACNAGLLVMKSPQLDSAETVLDEALECFDVRNRTGEAAPPAPPPPASPVLVAPIARTVQLVTEDGDLLAKLGAHVAHGHARSCNECE